LEKEAIPSLTKTTIESFRTDNKISQIPVLWGNSNQIDSFNSFISSAALNFHSKNSKLHNLLEKESKQFSDVVLQVSFNQLPFSDELPQIISNFIKNI